MSTRRDGWAGRIAASSGETLTKLSPLTGEPLAQVPQSGAEDVLAAFDRARAAQEQWSQVPAPERARRLLAFHDLVMAAREELIELIVAETGKTPVEAFEEVFAVAATARYYGLLAPRYLTSRRVRGVLPLLTRVVVNAVPYGVVGIISPWNYPFFLSMADGLAALVAGNAVVVKPASLTVMSAAYGAGLLAEAGIPADLWQVVAGPAERIGEKILASADAVCFTGSIQTGRRLAREAAGRLLPATFELAGKNPMIVLDDADPDRAAAGAVRSCFVSAGQLCVATERLYVADAVYDRFRGRLVERVRRMRLRPGMHWDSDLGTLIGPEQLDKVSRHVEDARSKGATVLVGRRLLWG
ncbi:succinate-semialdehyde dehydrogenase / glutarate-semialdehyde dehydrogenase [Raineyella antarctica]|uniref:Succinate-semialdehyde dehydrogenase / glutarate-semialdehyde dehydrogenase n=1 Tax=Raineyella antarctica TaxID=1577474 RepID=A0A1G6GYG8_9ACTN|nr:aldehyde dehydrogenase family protein [Raineyella antarctica]SDB87072.1 succinate-semialdehyde dehydrogenase / glutarate-semialdehyde dehydrogenase [Raineyella antarctica]